MVLQGKEPGRPEWKRWKRNRSLSEHKTEAVVWEAQTYKRQGPETKRGIEELRKGVVQVASREEMTEWGKRLDEGGVRNAVEISAHGRS